MTTKFYMMIGISGSGKSTLAKQIAEDADATIVSSDAYRKSIYGDESTQGDNVTLFKAISDDIFNLLAEDKNVVFDATNLSRKHRTAFLSKINTLEVDKIAVLCATSYEKCIEQNKNRVRQVPVNVIARMWKSINVPVYAEGWDAISVVYNYDALRYSMIDYLDRVSNFQQDNPHHSHTLGEHVTAVGDLLWDVDRSMIMFIAGLLHDNGKEYTKVFTDVRGNPSHSFVDADGNTRKMAHYYQHEEVGAYESLFYTDNMWMDDNESLFIAGVILYHMRPYQLKSQKSIDKLRNTIGEDMFDAVMALNKADIDAH